MIDGIPLNSIFDFSGWIVAAGLVIFGALIPRRTYRDMVHDRDEWRAAHRISEQARQVSTDQVAELLEHARTTDAVIRSLPQAARGGPT
jgi:hypothetical protein